MNNGKIQISGIHSISYTRRLNLIDRYIKSYDQEDLTFQGEVLNTDYDGETEGHCTATYEGIVYKIRCNNYRTTVRFHIWI